MKKTRFVPVKNYVIAASIIIGSILLSLYIFSWYQAYQDKLYSESYLIKNNIINNEITSIKELKSVIAETPTTYYLFINYTGEKENYKLEKDIGKLINQYELNNSFYYLNITDIKNNENYLDTINNTLNLDKVKITKVPTIIYFDGEELKSDNIITREDDAIMNAGDFQKLLDVFQIVKP